MDANIKKRVLLVITNSYAATNVIHSGLIKPLAEQFEIHILSNIILQKEIAEINQYFNIKIYKIDIQIPYESRLVKLLRQLEKAFFFHFFRIETQKIKENNKGFWYNLIIGKSLSLTDILGLSTFLLQFLRKKIIRLTGNNNSLNELYSYHFSGVVSSSPLDIRENAIVNFMKKKNIPSLAMIISWDNLTSKGIINANHDYVLVWNELMKSEYQRFYSIFKSSKPKIFITGIPRFDIYYKDLPNEHSVSEFQKRYNLHFSDQVILFPTSAVNHFPNQTDIVGHLLEYAAHNPNVKILVRCHAADNYELYKKFKHEKSLIIWHPHDLRTISGWMPDLDILYSLAEMMKYCQVCVNVASTIRLEAAICNKPVINVAYDGDLKREFRQSVKRFYAYSHQIPLNKLGIDDMAYNKNELFLLLDKILHNSFLPDNSNTDKIKKFTYHTGPFAVSATMKYIQQWLN